MIALQNKCHLSTAAIHPLLKDVKCPFAICLIGNNGNKEPTFIMQRGTYLNSLFELGSLSKAFGAYLVEECYVKKQLAKWNDPLQKYIPIQASEMTLLDALNHKNSYPERIYTEWLEMGVDPEAIFQDFCKLKVENRTDEGRFTYQNVFYAYLHKMFPHIYSDFKQAMMKDLNMQDTRFAEWDEKRQTANGVTRDTRVLGFAGGISSSINDMCTWMQFHLARANNSFSDLQFYDRGWWTSDYDSTSRIHLGGTISYTSGIMWDAEYQFGCCVLIQETESQLPKRVLNALGRQLYQKNFHCSLPLILKSKVQPFSFNLNGCYYHSVIEMLEITENCVICFNDKPNMKGSLLQSPTANNKYLIQWDNWIHGKVYYDGDVVERIDEDHFAIDFSYGNGKVAVFTRNQNPK